MLPGSCVVLTRKQGDEKETDKIDDKLGLKQQKVYRVTEIPEDLNVFSIVKHPLLFFSFCTTLFKIIKKEHISHVIFAHSSFFYFFSLLPLKLVLHLPFICIFHGEDIPVINLKSNGLFRWLINRLDAYACNSLFTHNRLQEFLGKKIPEFIAYPGVEEKFFQHMDKNECKKQFGVSDRKVMYTVGRLDKRKGHDLVIRAMPEIIKKIPDVIYLIGGTGPYLPQLKSLVEEHHLQDYVKFCGFIADKDICAFHHCGDVFVMPNRILDDGDTEGFGIVFLEASASSRPAIGGSAGGAIEAIEDGVTGYNVNPYKTEELVEKIIYLLTNTDKAKAMGKDGKKRVWENFRWNMLAAKLENELTRYV
ncbi:glycosyltransferase family 4 protein [Desulfosarcina sp. BuS5]|nr:glycosyltransferase family 4 protein [Desulfosarcina sp. BuS5]